MTRKIKECFTVPNNLLPKEFQDNRMVHDQVSLATIEKKCDQRDRCTLSEAEENAIERAKRVEIYRKQIDQGKEIEYLPM